MRKLYDQVTRFFLCAFDPYQLSDEPPAAQVWPFLKAHIWPMRRIIIASLIVTVIAAAVEVWLIQFAGRIIDILSQNSPAALWENEGNTLILAGLMVLIIRPILQFLRHATNDIAFDCNMATLTRWRAYDHLIRQSVGWFQEDLTGRTSSRLVDIGNYSADAVFHTLNAIAFGLVYMVGIIVLMAGTQIGLAIPVLAWLVLYIVLLTLVVPRMINAQMNFQSAKSALLGSVVDAFSNFDTLKLFAPKDLIAREQRKCLEDTRQALFITRQISVGLRSILIALEGFVMVGFVGFGIWLWATEAATIGVVASAVALTLRITSMAEWILDSVRWIFLRVGSLREALKTVGQPIAIPQLENAPELEVSKGAIEIENLHHHYGVGAGGLDGISLSIKPGERIGVVGQSGAGKSTLVNLILRFFETERGSIKIDGQDIKSVDQDSLRAAIGMVSQQAALLNKSVRDNILLGREDVSEQDMVKAAKDARAHDFIESLLDSKGRRGYQAHVGERGVKLSGGQRQRVALARVVLKDAPILILDEATSALDSEVEAEIQQSLLDVMQNKTVIAIAHRLSTIAHLDRIIVLDRGRIVEEGSHVDLLKKNGLYAAYWHRQSGGFIGTNKV